MVQLVECLPNKHKGLNSTPVQKKIHTHTHTHTHTERQREREREREKE
jgi:hypothetical protein